MTQRQRPLVKGWISHGTPLLSETWQFTRFTALLCWITHIFVILFVADPDITRDADFTWHVTNPFLISRKSIFQLCNTLTRCFLLQVHIFTANHCAGQFLTAWAIQNDNSLPKEGLVTINCTEVCLYLQWGTLHWVILFICQREILLPTFTYLVKGAISYHFRIACRSQFFSITTNELQRVFHGQNHYSPLLAAILEKLTKVKSSGCSSCQIASWGRKRIQDCHFHQSLPLRQKIRYWSILEKVGNMCISLMMGPWNQNKKVILFLNYSQK